MEVQVQVRKKSPRPGPDQTSDSLALKLLDSCFSLLSNLLFINFHLFWMLAFPILMHLELLLTTFNHLLIVGIAFSALSNLI